MNVGQMAGEMSPRIALSLSVEDVDFIVTVLGAVPTLQTVQAGKLQLIPLIREQAQHSLQMQRKEAEERAWQEKVRAIRAADQEVLLTKEAEALTPYGQAEAAKENIQKQLDLRTKLDAIEKEPQRQTGVHFRG